MPKFVLAKPHPNFKSIMGVVNGSYALPSSSRITFLTFDDSISTNEIVENRIILFNGVIKPVYHKLITPPPISLYSHATNQSAFSPITNVRRRYH